LHGSYLLMERCGVLMMRALLSWMAKLGLLRGELSKDLRVKIR
jgi:hypothetical protein